MPVVHTSTYITKQILLDINKIPENLIECANELSIIADRYREMAKAISEKNIKITAVEGTADCGSMHLLDEIEAGRLRTAGVLIDIRISEKLTQEAEKEVDPTKREEMFSKIPTNADHCFYIDPLVDEVLEKAKSINSDYSEQSESLENLEYEYHDENHNFEEFNETPQSKYPVDVDVDYDPEKNQATFAMHVQDLGQPLQNVKFDSATNNFTFYCNHCDMEHQAKISSVYSSLKTVTNMISQLQVQNRKFGREIGEAFQTVEDDLRLLQFLLETNYLDK